MGFKLRDLDLSLRDEIEQIKLKSGNSSAATSFWSMYMWRAVYGSKIVCQEGMYALKSVEGENVWFFPTGCEEAKRAFINDRMAAGNLKFIYATDEDVQFVDKFYPGLMKAVETPENSEYLYNVDEYKKMEGKRFLYSRKEINRLKARFNLLVQPLTNENVQLVHEIVKAQTADNEKRGSLKTRGDEFDMSFLGNAEENGVRGVLVFDGDEAVAVMAGVNINDEAFDIALGDHKAGYNGVLIYCMHQLAFTVDDSVKLLNGEEDLGIEGLRQWKSKIHPVGMVNMWEITV